ncbi:cation:proton antiporter [Streptomyces sp. AM 2-1-1]|uniref:cation:proton antiporter n=1 Tax=Streptomyces sp. AM 2-1-1 TaxID=3028709 RepID=UPI0023B8F4FC|nr:cation:proton antiporter [Streptomyces sp. AM 2-1-1]WEH39886.1 cation:proton antiporter [Streptomyces sp. AM 2-1-1]
MRKWWGAVRRKVPPAVPGIVLGAVGALVAGVLCGLAVDPSALAGTWGYTFGTSLLLAVGLYGSTYGIDLAALRADLGGVVAAVTLGVVLKAALIAGVMVLAFGRPAHLVLGIAVAQIDPLSVAALDRRGRMSERARSLLMAWAAFDDPMTVLLTLYAAGYAYAAAGHRGAPAIAGGGAGGWLTGLAMNAALLAGVVLLWWAWRRAAPALVSVPPFRRAGEVAAGLLVVLMLVLAAVGTLMLAVAVAGLVVRRRVFAKTLGRAVATAFLAASLVLGLFLAQGVALWPGLLLGATAFGAQALVALCVMPLFVRGLERRDRIVLGLGQQNGITAVLIALALEHDFPGTVAIVGPAVVTVNLLHATGQSLLARGAGPPGTRGEPRADQERHSSCDGPSDTDPRAAAPDPLGEAPGQESSGRAAA